MKKGDTFRQDFVVSESTYRGFKNIFKDTNLLHTDCSYAQRYGFRQEVMYGNILGGFLSYFVGNCLPIKNVVLHSQEIKFTKPVYLNDFLELITEIEGIFESVNAIEFKFSFRNRQKIEVARGKIQIGILR